MNLWKIKNAEWLQLAHLLSSEAPAAKGPGRPRMDDLQQIAEACLYRHYHAGQTGYRTAVLPW